MKDMKGAHSAHGDVLGLEALLTHPLMRSKWKSLAPGHLLEMGGLEKLLPGDEDENDQLKDLSGRMASLSTSPLSSTTMPTTQKPAVTVEILSGSSGGGGGAAAGGSAAASGGKKMVNRRRVTDREIRGSATDGI